MLLFNYEINDKICYLLTSLIVIYIIRKLTKRNYDGNLPSGPRPWPFVGNLILYKALGYKKMAGELREKYGDVILFYSGSTPAVVINDYDTAVEALVSKYPNELAGRFKSNIFDLLTEGGNDIAMANPGPRFNLHRKIAHGALRKFALDSKRSHKYIESPFEVVKEKLSKRTTDEIASVPVDPRDMLATLTYSNVCGMVYGGVYESFDDPELVYVKDLMKRMNDVLRNYFIPLEYVPGFKHFPLPAMKTLMADIHSKIDFMQKKIDDHRESYDSENLRDFIDFIIHEKEQYSEDGKDEEKSDCLQDVHIRQTLIDLFMAGSDTTSSVLYWLLGLLAKHTDVQEKLYNEISEFIQTNNQFVPDIAWKPSLPYATAVLQEVLRYSTVATRGLPHRAIEKCKIGGYDIPKDTEVNLNIYAFHFDKKYWGDDAEEFRPERFLIEKELDGKQKTLEVRPKMAGWAPFGFGKRGCLGEVTAKNNLFLFMIYFCMEYEFVLADCSLVMEEKDDSFLDRLAKPYSIFIKPRKQ